MPVRQRYFRIDTDEIVVEERYDEHSRMWLGVYPYFEEEPRQTPHGRAWRNVSFTECPHRIELDCGSCPHFRREEPNDPIGVCFR